MKFPRAFHSPLVFWTLFYLTLPLVIFFIGWLKPFYAVIATIPVLFCGWRVAGEWPDEKKILRSREISLVLAFSFAMTAFVGIGGFGFQDFDWIKHNAVLFDCVHLPWPVVLSDGAEKWPLVYYLAFYLPAALVGKFFGYAAAQITLWLWSGAGLALSIFWFARLSRLPSTLAALAFFAFSGLDFFANLLVQAVGLSSHAGVWSFFPSESWARIWQFPSHYWMLQWSPGQALAGWLGAGFCLSCPQPLRLAGLAFLFVCAMLWSPFAAVGLFLLAAFLIWRERAAFWMKCFIPAATLIFPLGILTAFYFSKISPAVAAHFGKIPVGWFTHFHYGPGGWKAFCLLILFIVMEFGIYLWFIRACFHRGSPERNLADACGITLILLLPITVGYESDLAMRASAPALFCLAALIARTVFTTGLTARTRLFLWLVILMAALTPLIEATRQAHNLLTGRFDPRTVPHQTPSVLNMPGHDHLKGQYVGSLNSFFTRELSR